MASINDLHVAIMKGQVSRVRDLAIQLVRSSVDISKEIKFANELARVNPGKSFQTIAEFLSNNC